jgi:hypothetical protein
MSGVLVTTYNGWSILGESIGITPSYYAVNYNSTITSPSFGSVAEVETWINANPSSPSRTTPSGTVVGTDSNLVASNLNRYGYAKRIMEDLPLPADYWQALIVIYNMRTKEGRDFLRDIIKEYFKTLQTVMGHLAQASTANLVTSWVNPIIISNILEHNYMTASGSAGGLEQSTQFLVSAEVGTGVLGS